MKTDPRKPEQCRYVQALQRKAGLVPTKYGDLIEKDTWELSRLENEMKEKIKNDEREKKATEEAPKEGG